MHNRNLEFWYNYTIKIRDYITSLINNNKKSLPDKNISFHANQDTVHNATEQHVKIEGHSSKRNDIEWL